MTRVSTKNDSGGFDHRLSWSPHKHSEPDQSGLFTEPCLEGWYYEVKHGVQTKDGNTKSVYTICTHYEGSPQDPRNGKFVTVWSNAVIGTAMEGFNLGDRIYIEWLGKKPSKRNPTVSYNDYDYGLILDDKGQSQHKDPSVFIAKERELTGEETPAMNQQGAAPVDQNLQPTVLDSAPAQHNQQQQPQYPPAQQPQQQPPQYPPAQQPPAQPQANPQTPPQQQPPQQQQQVSPYKQQQPPTPSQIDEEELPF